MLQKEELSNFYSLHLKHTTQDGQVDVLPPHNLPKVYKKHSLLSEDNKLNISHQAYNIFICCIHTSV